MNRFLKISLWISGGIIASIVLSALYYVIFALIFSSDVEKVLMKENDLYRKYLPEMMRNAELMESEIEFLTRRDENIYESVFKAHAPAVSEMIAAGVEIESLKGVSSIVDKAWLQSARAVETAARTEDCWREVFDSLSVKGFVMPPMITPVKDVDYKTVGASEGMKLSPFYKVPMFHDGLDIIAQPGAPVYATASGYVTKVQKAGGGKGNQVEITHKGGYVTRYSHLMETDVQKGRYVKAGTVVGRVGDSGRAFTTHLHYEILKDGRPVDPNHYFFGSVSPDKYLEILIKSASSGQSMD